MMFKVRRAFIAILCTAALFFVSATSASAATPTFGHKYQNGVGSVTTWLNYSSGVGAWEPYITNAANNWMYPGWSNPIYINFVSSNVGSNLDFHLNYDAYFGGGMNVLAVTKFFNSSSGAVNQTASNWYYAEIHINHNVYSLPSISDDMALGTTIHEMGHAFGLAHYNTNPYSIMCQTAYGRISQRVQKTDNDAINILY